MTGLAETVDALGEALGVDFTDEGERYRHRHVLAGLIAEWFTRHDSDTVRAALASTRLLWSPYRSFTDLAADDAHLLREHPLFATVEQPGVGTLLAAGSPIVVDGTRTIPSPAPRVGEDTAGVLTERLGLTSEQLDNLAADGLVGLAASDEVLA